MGPRFGPLLVEHMHIDKCMALSNHLAEVAPPAGGHVSITITNLQDHVRQLATLSIEQVAELVRVSEKLHVHSQPHGDALKVDFALGLGCALRA